MSTASRHALAKHVRYAPVRPEFPDYVDVRELLGKWFGAPPAVVRPEFVEFVRGCSLLARAQYKRYEDLDKLSITAL
jgi:hypothetical protein